MTRIADDYIWLTQPPRRHRVAKWLGFTLLIPLIVGGIGLTWQRDAAPVTQVRSASAAQRVTTETIVPQQRAKATQVAFQRAPEAGLIVPTDSVPLPDTSATSTQNAVPDAHAAAGAQWVDVRIKPGDTLSLAFERHQLSYRDSLAIAHLPEYGKRFTSGLKTGDHMRIHAGDHGRVLAVDFPLDAIRTLQVRRDDDGYAADIEEADVDHRSAYAVGTINTSFYVDALQAGLSDKLIMNLAHIFAWDIDFVLDIRQGDRFVVIYDQLYRDGEKIRDGKILAAEFMNRGRDLKALRYTDNDGKSAYYTPDGRAMKKAFIRTPLDQFRVSSHFSLGRKHPILNTIRKHEGTDYAAPTGTPIKAAGDGRIVFRGRNGGYGNMIAIRHNSRITTRYGHMSRFRSGLGVGSHVRQGQIIGYVGMTGLATGPHLHYEFRVNGAPQNPETVALPKAVPLPKKYHADFQARTAPLIAQMQALGRIQVASTKLDNDS